MYMDTDVLQTKECIKSYKRNHIMQYSLTAVCGSRLQDDRQRQEILPQLNLYSQAGNTDEHEFNSQVCCFTSTCILLYLMLGVQHR